MPRDKETIEVEIKVRRKPKTGQPGPWGQAKKVEFGGEDDPAIMGVALLQAIEEGGEP